MTPLWRQNDVAASFWRHNDVTYAPCVRWVAGSNLQQLAADALAPWVVSVAMVSVAIVLTMQDKRIPVSHKEWFQLPAPSQWVIEMMR